MSVTGERIEPLSVNYINPMHTTMNQYEASRDVHPRHGNTVYEKQGEQLAYDQLQQAYEAKRRVQELYRNRDSVFVAEEI